MVVVLEARVVVDEAVQFLTKLDQVEQIRCDL